MCAACSACTDDGGQEPPSPPPLPSGRLDWKIGKSATIRPNVGKTHCLTPLRFPILRTPLTALRAADEIRLEKGPSSTGGRRDKSSGYFRFAFSLFGSVSSRSFLDNGVLRSEGLGPRLGRDFLFITCCCAVTHFGRFSDFISETSVCDPDPLRKS